MIKLNLGSGTVKLEGWINIDLCKEADLIHDLTKPLPYADNSVDFIYSEHFIEHLDYEQGKELIKECYRVLKVGGVIRIATPDLDYIIKKYRDGDWNKQKWLEHDDYKFIDSNCKMINHAFRGWGHLFLYDFGELCKTLEDNGFYKLVDKDISKSTYPQLCNLETRLDSTLIIEAIK